MTSARFDSDVERHAGNAALAAATAASTSATDARSTAPVCSPVAGSYTGAELPDVDSTTLPSIQCEIRFIVTLLSDVGTLERPTRPSGVSAGGRHADAVSRSE